MEKLDPKETATVCPFCNTRLRIETPILNIQSVETYQQNEDLLEQLDKTFALHIESCEKRKERNIELLKKNSGRNSH